MSYPYRKLRLGIGWKGEETGRGYFTAVGLSAAIAFPFLLETLLTRAGSVSFNN